jgi:hypothetical protein
MLLVIFVGMLVLAGTALALVSGGKGLSDSAPCRTVSRRR